MFCLFCNNEDTDVVNSRSTRGGSQIWRRRKCSVCGKAATTYERYDMTHLSIVTASPAANNPPSKQLGQLETPYGRSKLFYSLAVAFSASGQNIAQVDDLVDTIEVKLVQARCSRLTREQLTDLVLETIKPVNLAAFMHYLASHGQINNRSELRQVIKQY